MDGGNTIRYSVGDAQSCVRIVFEKKSELARSEMILIIIGKI